MTTPPAPPQVAPQPDAASEVIALDIWAMERSRGEGRVELLNAFVTVERAAGHFTNTRDGWNAAYAAFADRAVS